jgi:cellulase/cellobiase CelA1
VTRTVVVTAPPAGGSGRCTASIASEWDSGFTARVVVRNTGTTAINGWQLGWSFADGTRVSNHWNATVVGTNPYTATPVSWNSLIQPGQQVEFGFNANKGRSGTPAPAIVLSGSVCG